MDISSLLKSLNAQHVQYVVIGATAFPKHGFTRATGDIDILIKPTQENARRTIAALARVGYDVTDLTAKEMLEKKILLRQHILATDIHPSAISVTFETVWRNRVQDKIEGVPVFVGV